MCCKYQKAMYEGTKAISDFEEIEASEIGEQPGENFDDEEFGDLGLAFNKDNFAMASPGNGSIKNVNINDIDLEEDFNPSKKSSVARSKSKKSKGSSR